MRIEYIDYFENLPLKIELVDVREYPIHWHKSIEVLFVLKGSIDVTIESETYTLEEGEVEIVNIEEAHRLFSDDENRVLIFQIEPKFFEQYYSGIEDIFFYTNSSDEGAQRGEVYDTLRQYLAILLCEIVQKRDDYDEFVEDTLVELLYLFINEFHYLLYEKEELKGDDELLERYHRIVKYIYNNYNNKISLQDIADKEFLSSHYLSHQIKTNVGISFKDYVNMVRVDESVKLLLDTDKTLSEISDEVGFSHIRYFNKHFKLHYKLTPKQYRKKYKIDDDKIEEIKKIEYFDLKDGLNYSVGYLENYERFEYEKKIIKLNIDASKNMGDFNHGFSESIVIGNIKELLKKENIEIMKEVLKNINFCYGKLYGIFDSEMGVSPHNKFISFIHFRQIFDFLISFGCRPHIIFEQKYLDDEEFLGLLNSFLEILIENYGEYEIDKWIFQTDNTMENTIYEKTAEIIKDRGLKFIEDRYIKIDEINPTFDTSYMIPYVIYFSLNNETSLGFVKAFDSVDNIGAAKNEVFIGDSGLISYSNIKKPIYYAYYFLDKLGGSYILKGDGYAVTTEGDDIQILLYSYTDEIDEIISIEDINKRRGKKDVVEKNFSINITNIDSNYKIVKYQLWEKDGSAYNIWRSMGSPIRIDDADRNLIKDAAVPNISFGYAKKTAVLHIGHKLKGYGATLIILKKVN